MVFGACTIMRHSRKDRSVTAAKVEAGLFKLFDFLSRIKPAKGTLGIEITDRCIKLAEIIPLRNNTYKMQNFLIEMLPDHVVDDGRIIDSSRVILTLQSMVAKLNIKVKEVHIILPSQLIMVRFLKLPDIPLKDLRKLVDFEMKHNIHLPFDAPFYDFVKLNSDIDLLFADQEENTIDHNLLQCDVMLVAAPQQLIDEYQEIFTSASLKPLSMEFKALSLFRVMEFTNMADAQSTILFIDLNEHLADVSIFHNRQLKITRTIPMNFAADPKNSDSEEVKEMFSEYMNQDSDFGNACKDLSFEVERLMNFYQYTLNNRDHEFSKVLISGDVQQLVEIANYLAKRMPCEISLMRSKHIQSAHPQINDLFPSIAVPIGLALRGR
jgi:type IV pilus assembly protein PilM